MTTLHELLLSMASRCITEAERTVTVSDTPYKGCGTPPYKGLLEELPPAHPGLYDTKGPPLWFARLGLDLEAKCGAKRPNIDVVTAWKQLQKQEQERLNRRQARVVVLLCKHYGIPVPSSSDSEEHAAAWQALAISLAMAHVPAFQFRRAVLMRCRGRAKKPNKLDIYLHGSHGAAYLYLLDYLDELRKKRKLTSTEEHLRHRLGQGDQVEEAREKHPSAN
jgi:hypothetical protein